MKEIKRFIARSTSGLGCDSLFSFSCVGSGMTAAHERKEGERVKIELVETLMAHLISKSGCMGYLHKH